MNETQKVLLLDGFVVCVACQNDSDQVDRILKPGDTYGGDKCDRCNQ